MEKLRLVRPGKEHEEQAMEYLEEFYADGSEIHGSGDLERYKDDYDGWLKHLEEMRNFESDDKLGPSETFFLMKLLPRPLHMIQGDDGRLVGTIKICLISNKNLRKPAYIGYSIRPSERQKGYNKVNLCLALKVCQNHDIKFALLNCDKDNVGSAKTMRALGGRLLREYPHQNESGANITVQWYVIDVNAALEKYASRYDQFVSEYPAD